VSEADETLASSAVLRQCKICSELFVAKSWQINKLHFKCPACNRAYHREWRDSARRRENVPKCVTPEYKREVSDRLKQDAAYREARRCEYRRRYYDPAQREKMLARSAVNNAIQSGSLTKKPCAVCGSEKSQAHHGDYSKPLDVIWFCAKHHTEHHAVMRRGGT
jgi:hypothetical protein